MGIRIYYYIIVAVLGFGALLPQRGPRRKTYILLMAALHTFICGWRLTYLTGDLIKYAVTAGHYARAGWFSELVFDGGRNFGFAWLSKLTWQLSGGDLHLLLVVIAVITEVAVAVVVYRYSPAPWLSYLLWNCFGFYIFGFSAIKQALAMGLLMFAFCGIMEGKPRKFLLWTLLAGCVHVPALIFLPAYWLARSRLSVRKLVIYVISAILIFAFRTPIVTFISDFYYEDASYVSDDRLGGRFLMIAALLIAGLLLRGFAGKHFPILFNLMVVAAIAQMFSTFDNIFTRLADYYFQFLILYLPMMLYPERDRLHGSRHEHHLALTWQQRSAAVLCIVLLALLFYYTTNLNITIENEVDNYLNYRFCWEG